ncbi:tryptophan 7-halogenase [Sphingomonas ginkgonis]|uniref:Tryptophan 7-halogenase n=2 Tax=Sphingomonas ginkgonis TaxID=2315330 RepID=A0A3R9X9T3_9SPHN|nr:tryptophan 7-halogenase [Sphingomonas ginkgonis]
MAACLLQQRWGSRGTRITLIESSAIPIIGVGEGSTPQLKAFFDALGIAEREWMPRCHATYKTGIQFRGWSDRPGFDQYFHPFPTALDVHTAGDFFHHCRLRRLGVDVPAHPDLFFLPARLAAAAKAPLPAADFPFDTSYGYHFDAALMGSFLREVATSRGVVHADARIVETVLAPDGDVEALLGDDGRRFEADLFVDASGFRALILEGALGEPHRSFAENLFNDRAVVAPTPLPAEGPGVCTRSTALSAGWAWHIPLTSRIGNGYVYSSRHCSDEAAASEFRSHVGLAADAEVRHLEMKVGRLERSWVRNALAVGLAQGFVEPLEATALHVVLATVEDFIAAFEQEGATDRTRADFNRGCASRIEGIRDYIVAHYRAAPRGDTRYWQEATGHDQLSDSLKALFTCWFTGRDMVEEIDRQGIAAYYPAISWHCLFGGYGNFPSVLSPVPDNVRAADMARVEHFLTACAGHYPAHSAALERLDRAERVGSPG